MILQSIPALKFYEMPEADICCGGAGSYSVTHYETAISINNRKMKNLKEMNVDILATACPICVMHNQDNIIQHKLPIKTRFVIDLLHEAMF